MQQVNVADEVIESLEGLALRRYKQKIKLLYKQMSPLDVCLETVHSLCLSTHGVRRIAFVIGSTVVNPQEVYMWDVEQDAFDETPEDALDEKSAAACTRGFMRSLMMSSCDIFAGQRACSSFFLLIEAPRGVQTSDIQVKQGFSGSFKKKTPVRMAIEGKGDAFQVAGEDLVWYQCGKAFKGFKG